MNAPSWLKRTAPAAAGLALALAALAIVVLVRRAPREASLDGRIVGRWAAVVTTGDVAALHVLDVHPDGRFRWTAEIGDEGTLTARDGVIEQRSTAHGSFAQSYAWKSSDVVTIAGPGGRADWTRARDATGATEAVDAALVGEWRSRSEDGQSYLEILPDGAYRYRAVLEDSGALDARAGRYEMRFATGNRTRAGTYAFPGADTLAMTDDGGLKTTWQRA